MGNLNTLGLEAVAHQSPDVLFTNLVAAITTIQEKGIGESVTANPEITKLLTNATNLDVQVMIASGNMSWDTFNAYATIPKLGKNHVLKVNSTRGEGDDEHALRLLANSKDGFLEGWVDVEAGKVHGVFTKVPVTITLGRGLFISGEFTPNEIAMITLHELGHCFAYFEQIYQLVSVNYAIEAAIGGIMSPKRKLPKVKIIEAYSKTRNVSIPDMDVVAQANSKKGVAAFLLQAETAKSVSETGANVYDATGFEFLSDQFASRFGNGTYLITALDKMHRRVGSDIYRSKSSFYTMQIVRTLTTIYGVSILSLLFPFTALIGIIMLINSSPHYSTYDHPLDRANRIRRDMISETKNSKLSKSKIKELQANVAMIDDVIRAMSKNDTVVQLLHRVFSPATRKQLKLKQGQQAIEKLLMSDLNLTATRFSTL